jgi:hypothetical protein
MSFSALGPAILAQILSQLICPMIGSAEQAIPEVTL